jgi:hypothetical protein
VGGRWRIVEIERCDRDAIGLAGPAFIELKTNGHGSFRFIAVEGFIDARWVEREGRPAVEFSWDGADEGDRVCGRGWAVVQPDGLGAFGRAGRRAIPCNTSVVARP